jgi:hypothetical protein
LKRPLLPSAAPVPPTPLPRHPRESGVEVRPPGVRRRWGHTAPRASTPTGIPVTWIDFPGLELRTKAGQNHRAAQLTEPQRDMVHSERSNGPDTLASRHVDRLFTIAKILSKGRSSGGSVMGCSGVSPAAGGSQPVSSQKHHCRRRQRPPSVRLDFGLWEPRRGTARPHSEVSPSSPAGPS